MPPKFVGRRAVEAPDSPSETPNEDVDAASDEETYWGIEALFARTFVSSRVLPGASLSRGGRV